MIRKILVFVLILNWICFLNAPFLSASPRDIPRFHLSSHQEIGLEEMGEVVSFVVTPSVRPRPMDSFQKSAISIIGFAIIIYTLSQAVDLLGFYSVLVESYPFVSRLLIALVLAMLGDWVGQQILIYFSKSDLTFSWSQFIRATLVWTFIGGVLMNAWFITYQLLLPGDDGLSRAIRWALHSYVFGALVGFTAITLLSLLDVSKWTQGISGMKTILIDEFKRNFLKSYVINNILWPMVHMLNYLVLPVFASMGSNQYYGLLTVVIMFTSVVWTAYFSFITVKDTSSPVPSLEELAEKDLSPRLREVSDFALSGVMADAVISYRSS